MLQPRTHSWNCKFFPRNIRIGSKNTQNNQNFQKILFGACTEDQNAHFFHRKGKLKISSSGAHKPLETACIAPTDLEVGGICVSQNLKITLFSSFIADTLYKIQTCPSNMLSSHPSGIQTWLVFENWTCTSKVIYKKRRCTEAFFALFTFFKC